MGIDYTTNKRCFHALQEGQTEQFCNSNASASYAVFEQHVTEKRNIILS